MEVDLLVKIVKISEEISNMLEYYIPMLQEIETQSANLTFKQEIKSDIQSLRFILYKEVDIFKQYKRQFEFDLLRVCNHEWIDDYIDKTENESQKITYCENCKLTKNH